MSRNRPQGTKSPERLVLHRVLINSKRFYIHTNLIKFVIAHFKLENRSMSCTFQLICIASLLAFSTFILVFMQNCRDCLFSNSEMTPMLPLNTRHRNAPGPLWPSNFQAKMLLFKVDFASAWYTIMHFKQKTHKIKP